MFKRKGQNIAEYSILIALIIAAAVAMQTYIRRGIQGRMADAVDHAPDTDLVAGAPIQFSTRQYEPYYREASSDVESTRELDEDWVERGGISRSGIEEETTRARGSYEQDVWSGEGAR
ncbi:MAG: hypothetical protein PVI33_01435 [Candidatus Omnitrophota bacterium]|jgi:hypothetical protein